MASTIVTKNSSTASAVPLTGDLTQGELAVNVTDKRLFTKNSGGTVVELGTNPASLALPNGTANGVAYLNGSKAVTTGSALTFDGTILGVGSGSTAGYGSLQVRGGFAYVNEDGINTKQLYLRSNYGGSGPAIQVGGTDPLLFVLNSSEQMRLTTTGLGIGTSSPGYKLTVSGGATSLAANQYLRFGAAPFAAGDGSLTNYLFSGSTSLTWRNAADSADLMYLSNSGNLGLGATPSAWKSNWKTFQNQRSSFTSDGNRTAIGYNWYLDSGATDRYIANDYAQLYQQVSGQHIWYNAASGTAGNAITFTQAMTLDASGNLLVGTTTSLGKLTVEQNLGGVGDAIGLKDTGSSYGSGAVYINFKNNAGSVAGKIEHTASTTVNYNTSSDARLKTDIGVAIDTSVIDQIVIHDFEWKEDGRIDRGVFAQEAHQIKPSAVSVGSDETNDDGVLLNPWGVDYSKFVPDLIVHAKQLKKTVQEQQALIQQLQADVAALKGN